VGGLAIIPNFQLILVDHYFPEGSVALYAAPRVLLSSESNGYSQTASGVVSDL
jgi:hypothetical protein